MIANAMGSIDRMPYELASGAPARGPVVALGRVDIDDMRGAVEILAGMLERGLVDLPVARECVIEVPDQKKDVCDRASERGRHERVEPQLVKGEQVDRADRQHRAA